MRQSRLHDLGRERERGGDRPRRDAAVVRAVRRPARSVAEEAPLFSFDHVGRWSRTVTRGGSPRVIAVAFIFGRIGDRILPVHVGRATAVFEIVDLPAAHYTLPTPRPEILWGL